MCSLLRYPGRCPGLVYLALSGREPFSDTALGVIAIKDRRRIVGPSVSADHPNGETGGGEDRSDSNQPKALGTLAGVAEDIGLGDHYGDPC
jgi:hypothetical protein